MDPLLLLKALILGVVEGLTEFLPISSTGHLILAGDLLDFNDERGKLFEIVIQSGAILAVCWEYRAKIASVVGGLTRERRAALRAQPVRRLPAAGCTRPAFRESDQGAPVQPDRRCHDFYPGRLRHSQGRAPRTQIRVESVDDLSLTDALKLGIAQAFALIPGTSRSGATIIGGLLFGLSRKAATEFSFFLAIPTLECGHGLSALQGAPPAEF